MLALAWTLCAFSPHAMPSRRDFMQRALHVGAAAAVGAPAASFAKPPPSPQQMLKSRAVYGSRVDRLQAANADAIMDEKGAFTLFISGAYGASADKPIRSELEKLEKVALKAAAKGDTAAAQAAIKQFVSIGQISELDMVPGSYYNAKSPCDRAGLQCGFKGE